MNTAQIAKIIKDECKKQNIPVSKLLYDCGIRKSFIYDLEKRNHIPSSEIIVKICEYLKISSDYLLQINIVSS